jgi:hypothetical protein
VASVVRAVLAVGAVAALVAVGAAGYGSAGSTPASNPLRLVSGIPVGVLDSPAGAVSAADNYLAAEDGALLDPALLRRVIATDWTVADRQSEASLTVPSAALRTTPGSLGDLHLTAAVAGDRLESYSPRAARVGVWHEVTFWSSSVAPAQHWSLDSVALVWRSGRWQVASRVVAPVAQTPVPGWVNAAPGERSSAALSAALSGMSAPYYGVLP